MTNTKCSHPAIPAAFVQPVSGTQCVETTASPTSPPVWLAAEALLAQGKIP